MPVIPLKNKKGQRCSAFYCPECDEVCISSSRHDFVQCKGGHFFVDGGFDYIRSGGNSTNFILYLDPNYFKAIGLI